MSNKKIFSFYKNEGKNDVPGRPVKIYLRFVAAVYGIAGAICAGLYCGAFGSVDAVSSYILAEELMHSMIRTTTAATLMALLINMRAGKQP